MEEEGGLHDRVDVGGGDDVHDEEGTEEGEELFEDVGPADGGVARVFEFVDDGGEGDVEEVVGHSEVGGVVVGCGFAGASQLGSERGDFGGYERAEGGELVVGQAFVRLDGGDHGGEGLVGVGGVGRGTAALADGAARWKIGDVEIGGCGGSEERGGRGHVVWLRKDVES